MEYERSILRDTEQSVTFVYLCSGRMAGRFIQRGNCVATSDKGKLYYRTVKINLIKIINYITVQRR